ncbi:MAG: hypothetical protein KGK10_05180 [Rhodospirillales bacterium]|nr:hypothetical protein [Rhodospirillales bacterium]
MLTAASLWQQRLGAWLAPDGAAGVPRPDPAVAEFRRMLRELSQPAREPEPGEALDEAGRAEDGGGAEQP